MTKLFFETLCYQLIFLSLLIGALFEARLVIKGSPRRIGAYFMGLSTLFLGGVILFRGLSYQRIPFSSLFEFLVMLVFLILGFTLSFDKTLGKLKGFRLAIYLVSLALMIGVLILEKTPISLLPALQSPWFFSHILSALLAYLSFSFAMVFALLYLIKKENALFSFLIKAVYFGLFTQTLLLVTGSLWALDTWGRFWAWDPKEVWALLTYFVFATALHVNFLGQNKKAIARLVLFGYLVLLFTFFGVSFGLSGLHAY